MYFCREFAKKVHYKTENKVFMSKITRYLMSFKTLTIATLAAFVCGFSSCSTDDNTSAPNSDIAEIVGMTLGTVTCNPANASSYTYSASGYKMTVNADNSLIYNADSLVMGTDLKSVPVTLTTTNYGSVKVQGINGQESYFIETGTIVDFTQPRVFTVTSSSGKVSRDYTVKVVAHQQSGTQYRWTCMSDEAITVPLQDAKAFFVGNRLVAMQSEMSAGTVTGRLVKYSEDFGKTWKTLSGVAVDASTQIGEMDGKLYVATAGQLYHTSDFASWSAPAALDATIVKEFLGGVNGTLYAVNINDEIIISPELNNGTYTWKTDQYEAAFYKEVGGAKVLQKTDVFPYKDYNFIVTPTRANSEVKQAFIIANKQSDKVVNEDPKRNQNFVTAVVWSKLIDPTEAQPWGYVDIAWNNHYYYLPKVNGLKAIMHNNVLIAKGEGVSKLYSSVDQGATWKSAQLTYPEGLSANIVALASKDKMLYLIGYNTTTMKRQVWRGYLEKDMWK